MSALPWLDGLLANEKITDICINGGQEWFVDQGNGMETGGSPISSEHDIKTWVIEMLASVGKTWDARYPFIDACIPTGHRIHVIFPPIARTGILISLRRLPGWNTRPKSSRWQGQSHYSLLAAAVKRGESILVCGATGSGKTTLMNDLLSETPLEERIIALEDTPELSPTHPHFLSLVSRPANADGFGEVTLRTLLRQTLRMRPDRIVLGECRGPEVLELLQALNTGHQGAMATLHANSAREALRRLELLCLLAAQGSIPLGAIRELLALGIRWIAYTRREGSRRSIFELSRVEGREGETILLRPIPQLAESV